VSIWTDFQHVLLLF